MSASVLDSLICPRCTTSLDARAAVVCCPGCNQSYPILGGVPVVIPDPHSWVARWGLQLAQFERTADRQLGEWEASLQAPDLLPATEVRCRAMLKAARDQVDDLTALLAPLRDGSMAPSQSGPGNIPPESFQSPLQRVHYLFRDWGWDAGKHRENQDAADEIGGVLDEGMTLGRTLVVGAGACRLAYDLHLRFHATETVALDLDPLLMLGAQAVIRGRTVTLTETSLLVAERDAIARRWELAAPAGPIAADRFHFLLADGLQPPFAPESFDTVVTPWFVDHVPGDLRDFLGVLAMLLVPGGRWINSGPLLYPGEVPLARRFTADEIFELTSRAGFQMGGTARRSAPHLLSPLGKRGRVEWILTFQATRRRDVPSGELGEGLSVGPPPWLIFAHLPVPSYSGQALFWNDNPLITAVMRGIDGQRSVNELTTIMASQMGRADLDPRELREGVRRCLAAFHPSCGAGLHT